MAAYIGSALVDVCTSLCSGVNVNFDIVFKTVHSLVNNKL